MTLGGSGHWVNTRSDEDAKRWLAYQRERGRQQRPRRRPSTRLVVTVAVALFVATYVVSLLQGAG